MKPTSIKIEIQKDGAKNTIERDEVDPITALDDLMNILFIAGFDIEQIKEALLVSAETMKKSHKNENKKLPDSCSI